MTLKDGVLHIDVEIESNARVLDFSIEGNKETRLPYYDGAVLVEPRKVGQTLETANKSMSENVVIKPIFYSETTNPSGGLTIVIGAE